MKKVLLGLLVVSFFIPSIADAACGSAVPIQMLGGNYYTLNATACGAAVRATIRSSFYSWTWNVAPVSAYPNNGSWLPFDPVVPAFMTTALVGGVCQFRIQAGWEDGRCIGCPNPMYTDQNVQIIARDAVTTTADNDVLYIIAGTNVYSGGYEFGAITANPVAGRVIPQVAIGSWAGAGPITVNLTWTDASPAYYTAGGGTQYMAGYNIYYQATTMAGPDLPVAPTSNETGWTLLGFSALGAAQPVVVTVPTAPAALEAYYFALAPVGAGSLGVTPFQTGFVGRSSAPLYNNGPGSITLISFGAISDNNKAVISWETGSEMNTAGYNILRAASADDLKIQVNKTLIPAKGIAGAGATYQFTDPKVQVNNTYFYFLEEVENNNDKTGYSGVSVKIVPELVGSVSN